VTDIRLQTVMIKSAVTQALRYWRLFNPVSSVMIIMPNNVKQHETDTLRYSVRKVTASTQTPVFKSSYSSIKPIMMPYCRCSCAN